MPSVTQISVLNRATKFKSSVPAAIKNSKIAINPDDDLIACIIYPFNGN